MGGARRSRPRGRGDRRYAWTVRRTPRFSWRGALFVVLGLIGVAIGLNAAEYRPFGVALAMLSFALGASLLGKAGRLSAALRPLVGRSVRVEVWGEPLPGPRDGLFDVESITGIGAASTSGWPARTTREAS